MESSDAAPFHPQAQIITSSKDIDSSIKHNPRIPDKISPDSLQGKKSGPDRLKLKFLDDQTHHVAIRILTDDEQKNLDKYGAAGGILGLLTLEHWRWKPLTVDDQHGNSVRILVNVTSAKNRLKQFADLKQIKESFQKGTFLDDISQRVLKHKLLNTSRTSFVNLESKDYKKIAAQISFPIISRWFAEGEIEEKDVDDFIDKLQQKMTKSTDSIDINKFKKEFILDKKIEGKLKEKGYLKELDPQSFSDCVTCLRSNILENKGMKEDDIDIFINKHKDEIKKVKEWAQLRSIIDDFKKVPSAEGDDKDVQKTEELKAQISLKISSGEIKTKKNLSKLLKSALFNAFKNEVPLTQKLLKNIWVIYTRSRNLSVNS